MANLEIGVLREQELFVVSESVAGVLTYPTASDYVVASDFVTMTQEEQYEESPKIYNSRDITDMCQNQTPPGSWSLQVALQPSGAAGTAPAEGELMRAALGKVTTVASTSVTYEQTISKPSYSLWFRKGHTVFHASGATVSDMKLMFDMSCYVKTDFSGQFMKMGWAGSSQLASAFTSGTTVTVDDAKSYTVGSKIYFENAAGTVTEDNSGSGYTVTAINTSTNVVTFTPSASTAFAVDDWIKGFLPTGTEVGSGPIQARKGVVKIDTVSVRTRSFELNMSDAVKYIDDERTTSGYPESYVEGQRTVTGSMDLYFRNTDLKYFYDARNKDYKHVVLEIGDTAGSIIKFDMPRTLLKMPSVENADPTLAIKTDVSAIGTSGEDSLSIEYT